MHKVGKIAAREQEFKPVGRHTNAAGQAYHNLPNHGAYRFLGIMRTFASALNASHLTLRRT